MEVYPHFLISFWANFFLPRQTFAADGVASVLAPADENSRATPIVQNLVQIVLVSYPHVLVAAVGAVEYPPHTLLLGKEFHENEADGCYRQRQRVGQRGRHTTGREQEYTSPRDFF